MSSKKEIIRDLTTGSVPKTLLTFAMPLFTLFAQVTV